MTQEQLLRGKISPGEMTNYEIHVITGVLRSFLSSLKEPLITISSRESFIKLAYVQDETDVQVKMRNYSFKRKIITFTF